MQRMTVKQEALRKMNAFVMCLMARQEGVGRETKKDDMKQQQQLLNNYRLIVLSCF